MRNRLAAVLVAATAFLTLPATTAAAETPYWQCVTFARMFSGIQIFGNAWTWWQSAVGRYDRGQSPKTGAVLVFRPQGRMRLGHVAVVSRVLTDRVIQITHANWSPINGSRGQVERDVTVVDMSANNDWSSVRVWYNPLQDLGTSVYTTYGFIYDRPAGGARSTTIAQGQSAPAARAAAQPARPVQVAARTGSDDPIADAAAQ